ncbi:hypothetical protein [Finegoldia magna]|nr:hypothetical protein [Finegoldia magna]
MERLLKLKKAIHKTLKIIKIITPIIDLIIKILELLKSSGY